MSEHLVESGLLDVDDLAPQRKDRLEFPIAALLGRASGGVALDEVDFRQRSNTAIILITHDLGVVAGLCDRVLVMYAGEAVECGSVEQIYYDPKHPYTRGLLESVPRLDQAEDAGLVSIPGNPPNLLSLPGGCKFRDRCPLAFDACMETPPMNLSEDRHAWRCVLGEGDD